MRIPNLNPFRPEARHALLACGALALLVAGTLSVTTIMSRVSAPSAAALAARGKAPVLFVPDRGNLCRQRLLDNSNWTIQDAGYVACDDEVSWNVGNPAVKYSADTRIDAVRSGFSRK
jgi:hypothetical protein